MTISNKNEAKRAILRIQTIVWAFYVSHGVLSRFLNSGEARTRRSIQRPWRRRQGATLIESSSHLYTHSEFFLADYQLIRMACSRKDIWHDIYILIPGNDLLRAVLPDELTLRLEADGHQHLVRDWNSLVLWLHSVSHCVYFLSRAEKHVFQ